MSLVLDMLFRVLQFMSQFEHSSSLNLCNPLFLHNGINLTVLIPCILEPEREIFSTSDRIFCSKQNGV